MSLVPRVERSPMLKKKSIQAWLSPEIFKWLYFSEEGGPYPCDEVACARPYEYLRHAEQLLRNGTDSMSRVDAISTLKRCLNHRLRYLKDTYALDKVPLPNWPKHLLDQMTELGIVRPFLLKYLMKVRNQIEHADARPPSRPRCEELVDVLWYFLRSTDVFTKLECSRFWFQEPTSPHLWTYTVSFFVYPRRSWCIEVDGKLPSQWISTRRHPARMEIDCTTFERLERPPHIGHRRHRWNPTVIQFKGTVLGPPQAITKLMKLYFQPWFTQEGSERK